MTKIASNQLHNPEKMSDEEILSSPEMKKKLSVYANSITDGLNSLRVRDDKNQRVGILIYNEKDRPARDAPAWSDHRTICINVAHDMLRSRRSLSEKYSFVLGLLGHELGHILYTSFECANTFLWMMSKSKKWYPQKPSSPYADEITDCISPAVSSSGELMISESPFVLKLICRLLNILEDGYIEERFMREYPGTLTYHLRRIRTYHSNTIESVDRCYERVDAGDCHEISVVLQVMLGYAKYGICDISDKSLLKRPGMIAFVSALPLVDAYLHEDLALKRQSLANEIFCMLWPIIRDLAKTRQEEQQEMLDEIEKMMKESGCPSDSEGDGNDDGMASQSSRSTSSNGKPSAGDNRRSNIMKIIKKADASDDSSGTDNRSDAGSGRKDAEDKTCGAGPDNSEAGITPDVSSRSEAGNEPDKDTYSGQDATSASKGNKPPSPQRNRVENASDNASDKGSGCSDDSADASCDMSQSRDSTSEAACSSENDGTLSPTLSSGEDCECNGSDGDSSDNGEEHPSSSGAGEECNDAHDSAGEDGNHDDGDMKSCNKDASGNTHDESDDAPEDQISDDVVDELGDGHDEDDGNEGKEACPKNKPGNEQKDTETCDQDGREDAGPNSSEENEQNQLTNEDDERRNTLFDASPELPADADITSDIIKDDEFEAKGGRNAAREIDELILSIGKRQKEERQEEEMTKELQAYADAVRQKSGLHSGIPYVIHRMRTVPENYKDSFKEMESLPLLISTSKRLARLVEPKLKDDQAGGKLSGYYSGKSINLSSLLSPDNNGRCFNRYKLPQNEGEMCVGVLIDETGSMCAGSRCVSARYAAITLLDFCKRLSLPVGIYGHSAGPQMDLFCYASFDHPREDDKYRLMDTSARGLTRDGAALQFMYNMMAKRPEKKKLLIVISDGQPQHDNYYGEVAKDDITGLVKWAKSKGIATIAAAIGSDRRVIKTLYGHCLEIDNLERLPSDLTKLIVAGIKT